MEASVYGMERLRLGRWCSPLATAQPLRPYRRRCRALAVHTTWYAREGTPRRSAEGVLEGGVLGGDEVDELLLVGGHRGAQRVVGGGQDAHREQPRVAGAADRD